MNTLYIVSGANGSGKTTFAKILKEDLNLIFVNADEIAKEIAPLNTTGGKMAAGKLFFKRTYELIDKRENFILESTLSGKYLKNIITKVQKLGYQVKLIYIFLDNPSVCIERIKERVLNGGHHVPNEDVIRRYYRSKNNFWQIYKHLVDNWFIIYNTEINFKEFCIGSKENYTINDNNIFSCFIKDIKNG